MEDNSKNKFKMTDKAFSRLLITSVLGIILCITCLCSATWAWYSAGASSSSNTLGSGKFDLDVTVVDENNAQGVTQSSLQNNAFTLENASTYTVTLKTTDDTTVTKGFCTIRVGDDVYYTDSLYKTEPTFTFKIQTLTDDVAVSFSPAWGLPSADELIEKDEMLTIGDLANA